jgi:hypothetical protein
MYLQCFCERNTSPAFAPIISLAGTRLNILSITGGFDQQTKSLKKNLYPYPIAAQPKLYYCLIFFYKIAHYI